MNTDAFINSLKDKKVPLLVLDQKWHRLFAIHGKTDDIKATEQKLNSLLVDQGRLTNEVKNLKKLKNKLMDEIMENMDGASDNKDQARLIDEINEKISDADDALLDIPAQIKAVNEELMLLSMEYFYDKIRVNQSEAEEIQDWINNIRVELKKNIIRKQNRDINNKEIYSYLHDIFGREVIDLFDIQYDMIGEDN